MENISPMIAEKINRLNVMSLPIAVVLGGTEDHVHLITKLKTRGYFTVLIDYYEISPAKPHADFHIRESTLDRELVLKICEELKTKLVISTCIDQALLTMCYVAEKLSLPAPFSYDTAQKVTNKIKMKEIIKNAGIPTANFCEIRTLDEMQKITFEFPMVVKPADSNGSFGVRKVVKPEELYEALSNALDISRSKTAIVEEFVEGKEISVDTFIKNGTVHVIMLSESRKLPDEKNGFPIYQSRVPPVVSPTVMDSIQSVAQSVACSFKLDNIPMLVQVLVNQNDVKLIEFGARIGGGGKIHLIRHVTGFDILEAFLSSILGESPDISVSMKQTFAGMNYVYCEPGKIKEIKGLQASLEDSTITEYFLYKKPGDMISSHNASKDRIMAFICLAESEETLDKKIRIAVERLQVLDENDRDIMIKKHYVSTS